MLSNKLNQQYAIWNVILNGKKLIILRSGKFSISFNKTGLENHFHNQTAHCCPGWEIWISHNIHRITILNQIKLRARISRLTCLRDWSLGAIVFLFPLGDEDLNNTLDKIALRSWCAHVLHWQAHLYSLLPLHLLLLETLDEPGGTLVENIILDLFQIALWHTQYDWPKTDHVFHCNVLGYAVYKVRLCDFSITPNTNKSFNIMSFIHEHFLHSLSQHFYCRFVGRHHQQRFIELRLLVFQT